ncbi:unnamed protein product [Prunus armeniaca]|uniref:Subtilisin-like protease fibronectin type-III domain-containing protein n=1 Tax=Prunus armeniaca TaxID=36596 RepID=A0A6J5UVV3_PRUAR|nr:unnamed protein product [Prunus armeniaca]CAB4310198.1 unnamed protein product [Prunus armeniaca]
MFYLSLAVAQEEQNNLQTYIVWVQRPVFQNSFAQSHEDLESWYQSFLPETSAKSNQLMTQRMVHTYHNVAIGFAAKLTPEEVKEMGKKEGFVSAHPERILPLLTTHSLDLGASKGKATGRAPLDQAGHGTHTSSTAAGNFVEGVSAFGVSNGTAVGMAPYAHLAIYRVCGLDCAEGDVLAAMDAAIHDGVDVLFLSLGWPSIPFYEDVIAVGTFGAISMDSHCWSKHHGQNIKLTPTATILFNGSTSDPLAPKVATFSSRGPNTASPGILKPDIIGPGVDILAAWPFAMDWTQSNATFNIMSDVFAIGAGHVSPSKANNPGLIYNTQPEDYIPYLCGLNYTDKQIQVITRKTVNCSQIGVIPQAQLNYPSFSITTGSNETESQYYTRTVRNIGPASSTYNLDLFVPHKMGMSVKPEVLTFTEVNQEITYHVEFIAEDGAGKDGVAFGQGYLRWVSDKHIVTSPISVIFDSK